MDMVIQKIEKYHDRFRMSKVEPTTTNTRVNTNRMINSVMEDMQHEDTMIKATETILERHISVYEHRGPYVKQKIIHRGSPIVIRKSPVTTHECQYQVDIEKTQHWSLYGALANHAPSELRNPIILYKRVVQQEVKKDPDSIPIIWRKIENLEIRRLSRIIGKNIIVVGYRNKNNKKILFESRIDKARDTIYVQFKQRYTVAENHILHNTKNKTKKHVSLKNAVNIRYFHKTQQEAQDLSAIISDIVSINGKVPNIESAEGIRSVPNSNGGEGIRPAPNNNCFNRIVTSNEESTI